jgi:hypothetical protein
MLRWGRISGLVLALFCLVAPAAHAAPLGRSVLVSCDRDARQATFQGQVSAYRKGGKMQLRFTLQASTPDEPRYRKIDADGFGQWITAPAGLRKYTYDKTVEALLAPAGYRAVVDFRWRDARGRLVRTEKAISPVCKQPDERPDLILRNVRPDRDGFVAVVVNRGRQVAGAFDVDFLRDGVSVGTARVMEVAAGAAVDVFLPGGSCTSGQELEAVVDPLSEVDETDEENDAFSVTC